MRCSRSVVGFVVLVVLGVSSVFADGDQPDELDGRSAKRVKISSLPQLPPPIHDALQSQNFAAAVEMINAELKKEQVDAADYLLYLKGRAQTELGQYPAADETFNDLESRFSDGRWVARSRFGRADVLIRQRKYREAGEIYRAESERLLSAGRRDELAGIYLEFADRYFEGIKAQDPSAEKKPDYGQAATYYQQSLTLQPSLKKRQQIELRIARCRQELGQHDQAIAGYQQFLGNYTAKTTPGDKRAPAALEVQARYQLGRAQLAAGQATEARKTWQDFLAAEVTKKSGGELVSEATYRLAATYGIPAPGTIGDLELGVRALEKFLAAFPKHKLSPQAELQIAQSYAHHARYDAAIARLKTLIGNQEHAGAEEIASARMMLGQSYFAQKKFDEAISAWREFLDKHPTDKLWSNVQRQVVNSEFEMAAEQRRLKKYDAARELWSTFLNKYPLDSRAPLILFQFGQMKYAEAVQLHADELKNDVAESDQPAKDRKLSDKVRNLFESAKADWSRLVSKYAGTKEASQAAFMIGLTLEDRLGRLKDALEAYKKVAGPFAGQAKSRIANLTEKQLEIVTERKYRTNEKPEIRLSTRNLSEVSVKLYRIDMSDYFRKMHLATGVESLDIALIDPDKSWEYKIEDFEEYRRLTNSVTIPVEGPGVTAVTVSSDKLEATTMLVVSDIDVIVKSSRNELFAFVENMVTQKPAEGVSLLISDGKKVFAEELTGKDGIVQKTFDELKSVTDLRVFAIGEGHAASTVTNLEGLDFAVGLSAKGYLFTERPAYRAGQLVNLKGIVRWVAEDRYTFKAGEKYRLDVYDSRGRVVHTEKVALNEFGAFADHFLLPATAPQGNYRVHLHQPGKEQSYETQFQVHDFKLEPIHIVVDLPREVYFRGEKVEGTIELKYYYGTPLAGRTIQYRLGDGRLHTVETDAAGKAKVSFETERYSESQPLTLLVQYPERNLATAKTVYLATRGFNVGVRTLRKVYIAGETFDATAAVADPAGKPIATDLKLEVIELTKVDGKRGERIIETLAVKSDKDKGKAQQTLRIEKAGRYVVRATGTDQFGNPVSGQYPIMISGDDDSVRLRILAEKHHYKVGDDASVQLHWRDEPALALVTFEGAKVLGYRLVELKQGSNPLAIPLESSLAPNFLLSVAVMENNRFHQTQSEFRVSRKLNITVTPQATTVKPGDPLKVDLTVTDSQGKPVSAELSLAMIRKNLLDRFGDNRASIDEFFGAGYRKPAVKATASSTFRYRPTTRAISGALLAEAERLEIRDMERAALESSVPALVLSESGESDADSSSVTGRGRGGGFGGGGGVFDQPAGNEGLEREESFVDTVHDMYDDVINPVINDPITYPKDWKRLSAHQKKLFLSSSNRALFVGTARRRALGLQLGKESKERLRESDRNGLIFTQDGSALAVNGNLSGRRIPQAIMLFDTTKSVDFLSLYDQSGDVNSNGIVALNGRGELQVLWGFAQEQVNTVARGDSLHLLPAEATAETAYWNPLIVTDKAGKATVTFHMPGVSTAWTLRATGIDAETLSGAAEAEVIAKRDLFGELKTPLAFTEGDKANILVEVHNATLKKGEKIDVRLKSTLGERTTELRKSVTSDGPGIKELSFPLQITRGDAVKFELTVTSGETSYTAHSSVPVQGYGMPVFATRSGSAAQNTIVFVGHEAKLPVQKPSLEIVIGPSLNRTLLDSVLGGGLTVCEISLPGSGLERAISDALGGVSLLKTVGDSRSADSPEATALAARIAGAISLMVSGQREDGGWAWSGRPETDNSDRFLSSRVVWALAAAREAGFSVPNESLDKGVAYLKTKFTSAIRSDREAQSILLHGLAQAGQADFAFANRLYRERNSLRQSGLLHLALILAKLDRKEMAADVLKLVKINSNPKTANRSIPDKTVQSVIPWMQSGVEMRALYLLALEQINPANPQAAGLADWLMAARRGARWRPEKANGPAVSALAEWFSRTKHVSEKYTLTLYVNDRLVEKIEVDPAHDGSRRIAVPKRMLVDGKQQRINFDIEGRGRFSYSAVLSGFVAAEKITGNTKKWYVTRTYEPALQMFDGQVVPRGFNVLTGSYRSYRNPLTQLPMGERGEVRLRIRRSGMRGTRDEPLDYLVVTEPIPAGAMVLTDSLRGSFERYEITPGAIRFFIGDRQHINDIHYTLAGYLPGKYRAAPTLVRSFYRPDLIAVAKSKTLDVLGRGEKSRDEYKLTPTELYELGKRLAAKREYQQAAAHLTPLFRDYRLKEQIYREVVQMLFTAALDAGTDNLIVEYFEIVKEKFPEVEIDFASILKVGQAYQELGEYERSFLVFRATLEAGFQRESQIVGFLDERGEFLRSVGVMERLLNEYPSESYVATATYALAQEVYGKASELAGDQKLREAKITRVDLIASSIGMLDHFLSVWPKDPAADQAGFSLATAHLDLEQYKPAIVRCQRFAELYPNSKLLDSFWYVIGYSQFALGEHEAALEICRKVAETKRKDPVTGVEVASVNKWQAIYIMGQVYHSLGQPSEAIGEYERVKKQFPDATEAIDFFTRKEIKLSEVTTVKPGEEAKVPLTFRNVATANIKVYRIDLLKFGLMQRNLDRITAINLAGIRPYHELTEQLGDGNDFRDREKPLTLPLKEEGAYLVVCRGENLYASGLVLVSPLGLEIQEDDKSGRVRVTVKNTVEDRYAHKVHVKVIGSQNDEFTSGATDLRGIFIADAIVGTSTIIAKADKDRYAFFRGKTVLGEVAPSKPQSAASQAPNGEAAPPQPQSGQSILLQNVIKTNSGNTIQQRQNYRDLLENRQQGVKAEKAY